MRVLARGACLIGCLWLAAACTSPGPGEDGSSAPAQTSPAFPLDTATRSCDTSVHGDLGSGWRKDAVILGPIGFLGLGGASREPDASFRPQGSLYHSLKALAVVSGDGAVTVSIDPADLDRVRLLYDPSSWDDSNLYPLDAGDRTTVFASCGKGGTTQFNGGFLVTRRTCATLVVTVGGAKPVRRLVSFGSTSCPE